MHDNIGTHCLEGHKLQKRFLYRLLTKCIQHQIRQKQSKPHTSCVYFIPGCAQTAPGDSGFTFLHLFVIDPHVEHGGCVVAQHFPAAPILLVTCSYLVRALVRPPQLVSCTPEPSRKLHHGNKCIIWAGCWVGYICIIKVSTE